MAIPIRRYGQLHRPETAWRQLAVHAQPLTVAAGCGAVLEGHENYSGLERVGWDARIRTWEWRNQNPLPYHLATSHRYGLEKPAPAPRRSGTIISHRRRSNGAWQCAHRGLWRTCRLRQDGPLPAPFGLVSRTQIKRLRHIQQIAITPLSPAPPNLARLGGKPKFRLSVGRSVAQPGSALASGARGRRFESSRSDQFFRGLPINAALSEHPQYASCAITSWDCELPPPA